jgi:hypothetical protein
VAQDDRSPLPDVGALSSGAISLLAAASGAFGDRTGDRRREIANSAALRRCWKICGELPEQFVAYRARKPNRILNWLGAEAPPDNLFMFCGWLSLQTHLEICQVARSSRDPPESPTGFDHSVYLAVGQCLSDILGMAGGVGPSFGHVGAKLAASTPASLQRSFLKHYLGNVMQDYFEAADIRRQHRKLPASTEADLRSVDAMFASDIIFAGIETGAAVPWAMLHARFKAFLGAIFLAEREQYDNA